MAMTWFLGLGQPY